MPGEGRPRTAMLERVSQELLEVSTLDVLDSCRSASFGQELGKFADASGVGGNGLGREVAGVEMAFPGRDLTLKRSLIQETFHANKLAQGDAEGALSKAYLD
jgi:hypothetical protein